MATNLTQESYEEISSWFEAGGKLMSFGCTPRPSQQLMVDYICQAVAEEKPLICEAPTGVGKTFSYLFPLAKVVQESQKTEEPFKVVISTATKNLQRQLKEKDFVTLSKVFPKLRTFVWMGAGNYLCGVRLRAALRKRKLPESVREEIANLNAIYSQLKKLPNGWRDELPFPIQDETWNLICGDSPCCYAKDVQDGELFCYKRRAFAEAKRADILCVNHTFMATMAIHAEIIHPGSKRVLLVIDEAHEFEDSVRRSLNQDFSINSLRRAAGLINNVKVQEELQEQLSSIKKDLLDNTPEEPIIISTATPQLTYPLTLMGKVMNTIVNTLVTEAESQVSAGAAISEEDLADLSKTVKRIHEHGEVLRNFLSKLPEDAMMEVSKPKTKTKEANPIITYYPFHLENEYQKIWALNKVQILTSATIFNTANLGKTAAAFGFNPENTLTALIPHTFDYKNCVRAFSIAAGKSALEAEDLTKFLKPILDLSAGNALVLFTNYHALNICHASLEEWAKNRGYNLLAQGKSGEPSELVEQMKQVPNTIIFGTNSFWAGVDIPGQNLCNVVITKLPFRLPDNFVKGYSEFIQKNGGNAFQDWSIPDMINKCRQGSGRLIRSEKDRGLLFVLDPRFQGTSYGYALQRLLFPQEKGRSVVSWNIFSNANELPEPESFDSWLGITRPEENQAAGSAEDFPEDILADENIPF
jgi:ATP-dependent DNA helicase DinG